MTLTYTSQPESTAAPATFRVAGRRPGVRLDHAGLVGLRHAVPVRGRRAVLPGVRSAARGRLRRQRSGDPADRAAGRSHHAGIGGRAADPRTAAAGRGVGARGGGGLRVRRAAALSDADRGGLRHVAVRRRLHRARQRRLRRGVPGPDRLAAGPLGANPPGPLAHCGGCGGGARRAGQVADPDARGLYRHAACSLPDPARCWADPRCGWGC